jgi:hypothetical protein
MELVKGDRVRYNEDVSLLMGDFGMDEGIVIESNRLSDTVMVEWSNGDRLEEKVDDLERLN